MKLTLIATMLIASAVSFVPATAFGQAAAPAAEGQAQPPMSAANARVSGGGNFGGFGSTSLMCLEWHCQGTECICIRFTTERVVARDPWYDAVR